MSDTETLNVYDVKAQEYADLTQSDAENAEVAAFMNNVKSGGRVLDFGCGPGHFAARMAKAGFEVEATDASSEMVKLANLEDGVSARCETFEMLDALDLYDGVFANFSLLHAQRKAVAGHVAQITRALKSGGVFHIGMKTGAGEKRDKIGRHYCYFSENELATMMGDNGLTIIHRNHGRDTGLDGAPADWVVLQGRKS